jgi:hypothetical protein
MESISRCFPISCCFEQLHATEECVILINIISKYVHVSMNTFFIYNGKHLRQLSSNDSTFLLKTMNDFLKFIYS